MQMEVDIYFNEKIILCREKKEFRLRFQKTLYTIRLLFIYYLFSRV